MSVEFDKIMEGKNLDSWYELDTSLYGFDDSDPDCVAVLELKAIYDKIKDQKTNVIKVYEEMRQVVKSEDDFIGKLEKSEYGKKLIAERQRARECLLGYTPRGCFRRRTEEQIEKQDKSDFEYLMLKELNEIWNNSEKDLKALWKLYKKSVITKAVLLSKIAEIINGKP